MLTNLFFSTVIGVAQLINKVRSQNMKLLVNGLLIFQLNGQHFDDKDTEKMEAFAMFCGIGIHNTKTYESTCKLMAKQVERKRENKTL